MVRAKQLGIRLKVVDIGVKFYIEVRYRGLTARVRVYRSFQRTYKAVRNCLRHSMNCRVGGELRPYLKSVLRGSLLTRRVGTPRSRQEKMLAQELWRLKVPFKVQVPIAGYLVDFLIGDRIVVEVEGLQHHLNPEREARRLKKIEEHGYEVHRISSHEVAKNPAAIAEYVREVYLSRDGQKCI